MIDAAGKKRVANAASKPAESVKTDYKLFAFDAAAKVFSESDEPFNAKQMIEAMATRGYWTSPVGQTPWATLYSDLSREITVKGDGSRLKKTERGQFAANG